MQRQPTCAECGLELAADRPPPLCPECQLLQDLQTHHGEEGAPALEPLVESEILASDLPAGTRLGDYRILHRLGIGGMGAVYLAEDTTLRREVAVKVLTQNLSADAEFSQRFLREARAVAAVNHPHIVQIYFIGQEESLLYYAMEFVNGQGMDGLLRDHGQFDETQTLKWIRQAAEGLQDAHKHGFIHRDIKPANLMVTQEGVVKIADFGLARKVGVNESLALTTGLAVLGTPLYMSPEQALAHELDHRSDIYSLGATFYHLLAGRAPFIGKNVMETILQHINDPLVPIHQFNSKVSPQAERVLIKMMAKEANDRYQSYEALLCDLTIAAPPVPLASSPQPIRNSRPRSLYPIAAALLVAVLGLMGINHSWRTESTPLKHPIPQILAASETQADAAPAVVSPKISQNLTAGNPVDSSPPVAFTNPEPNPALNVPTPPVTFDPPQENTTTEPATHNSKIDTGFDPFAVASTNPKGKTTDVDDAARWMNVPNFLRIVDPKRDTLGGEWKKNNENTVLIAKGDGVLMLLLPYQPPAEYDFRVDFTRTAGASFVAQLLGREGRGFEWVMDDATLGFELVGGKNFRNNPTTLKTSNAIGNGRKHTTIIQVRNEGLRAYLDGKLVEDLKTDYKNLSTNFPGHKEGVLGVATRDGTVAFQNLQVIEVSGKGKLARSYSATYPSSATREPTKPGYQGYVRQHTSKNRSE